MKANRSYYRDLPGMATDLIANGENFRVVTSPRNYLGQNNFKHWSDGMPKKQ